MTASMMLQSKILKTKKRLSDDSWNLRTVILAFFGLIATISFALRTTFIAASYGVIESEIPTVSINVNDPDPSLYAEKPRVVLGSTTPLVVLTEKEFYFGEVSAFTQEFSDVRNKFFIKHKDGAPDLGELIETMGKWMHSRSDKEAQSSGVVLLLPKENIPSPIVIQAIAGLKSSAYFTQVILASGIL